MRLEGDAPPLEMRDGRVALHSRVVLDSATFALGRGEFLALLGANGSGKTTLVRALLGLTPIQRGEVRLFGVPVERFRQWQRVGYVPQRSGATTGVPATVAEVVLSGRVAGARRWGGYRAADRAAAAAALGAVGLEHAASASVATLSGGQQQRVLIARALATQPDVLVLDEPTSGVDLEHRESFAATLAALVGEGRSTLVVAHDLGLIESLVTRTVVLDEGRIVYDGKPLAEHARAHHVHHHLGSSP